MAQKIKSKIVRRKNSSRKQRKKNTKNPRTWKQRFFIFVVIIFIGCVGYIFLCSNLLNVHQFDIRGTNRVDKNQIINVIESDIDGQVIACLKKKNYFFVNKHKIIKDILKDNRIKNVNITKQFPDKIIIDIQEYDDVAIWCKSMAMKSCFVLNGEIAEREITMEDPVVVENKHFVIVDETHQDISIGDHVMTEEYLNKIKTLSKELVYVLDVKIEQPFRVASRGSHEVQFMTDEGWYIIIDLSHDLDEVFDIAKLFVKKVELPSRRSDLEYVDMRFSEKIFYKMKDGVEQSIKDEQELNSEIEDKQENE